jgi:enoyl-CoA hydratase/carnithine racemase
MKISRLICRNDQIYVTALSCNKFYRVLCSFTWKNESKKMALLKIEKNHGIATVSLNRPEKRNAMSFALLKELVQTAKKIKSDKSIRCVILTGEANVFSAGIDLSDLNNPKNTAYAAWELIKPGQSLFQKAFLIWQELPVPVIAAIEGYCFGAGMQLALAADIRIAHPSTQMSIMESRWGLVPDMGLTRSIKGVIGIDLAKELTLTARVFDAEYAKQIGLVTHLDEKPMLKAEQIAEEMLQRSPDALMAAKRVLDAMEHQPKKSLRLEKIWQLKLLVGKNSQIARKKDKNPEVEFLPRQYK